MPKKKPRGRPKVPKSKALGKTFGARLRPDEEESVTKAIKTSGIPASEWIRAALLEKAARR